MNKQVVGQGIYKPSNQSPNKSKSQVSEKITKLSQDFLERLRHKRMVPQQYVRYAQQQRSSSMNGKKKLIFEQIESEMGSEDEKEAADLFEKESEKNDQHSHKSHQDGTSKLNQLNKNKQIDNSKKKDSNKRVSFSQKVSVMEMVDFDRQRKWDVKVQGERKGKFSPDQQKTLMASIQTYLQMNDLRFQDLTALLITDDDGDIRQKKWRIWATICSVLPQRSLRSSYRFLKRQLDPHNYQGHWTTQQEEHLQHLVERYGRKWRTIAKQMKRSAQNVKDKFRQMGEDKKEDKAEGMWTFQELVRFLKLIDRQTKTGFFNIDIEIEMEKKEDHDRIQRDQLRERKYNSKKFMFHNVQTVSNYINAQRFQQIDTNLIRWQKIAEKMGTRTDLQCKNKLVSLFQANFRQTTSLDKDEQIVKFLHRQHVQNQNDINWQLWQGQDMNAQEACNRWKIMKKHVEGRIQKSFQEVLVKVMEHVQTRKDTEKKQRRNLYRQ